MLGEKLMRLRKKQGYSQEEAAALLDVTRQTISNWECGQAVPSIEKAAELARIYHISLDDLMENDVEIIAKEGEAGKKKDLHLLQSLVGKCCILECEDTGLFLDTGFGDLHARILDVNEDWLKVEYERRKEMTLNQKEKVVKLVDLSAVKGFEIVEEA